MIQYTFLLLTRLLTIIPMSMFIVKIIKRFRNKKRDFTLDETAKGMTLVVIAMLVEAVLFAAYDIFRVFNHVASSSPLWIILIWCVIRVTLVLGILILFAQMYTSKESK